MLKSNCSDTDFRNKSSVISRQNPKHQGCPRPPSEMKTIQSVQPIEISIAQNPMRDRRKMIKHALQPSCRIATLALALLPDSNQRS